VESVQAAACASSSCDEVLCRHASFHRPLLIRRLPLHLVLSDSPARLEMMSNKQRPYSPLSPIHHAQPVSYTSQLRNACASGRIPLCLVIVLILAFIAWHVETDTGRQHLEAVQKDRVEELQKITDAALTTSTLESVNPRQRLPVKSSYRALILGDSLTCGYRWMPEMQPHHPYLTYLSHLLEVHHPHIRVDFTFDAEPGECVISTCMSKSMIARATDDLAHVDPETHTRAFYDFAIILGGTNDLFHDFDAKDISHGLQTIHSMIWDQKTPSGAQPVSKPKTIALTVPQWGDSDLWRPPNKQSKLHPSVAGAARGTVNKALSEFCLAHSEECTLIDLDVWFPRHTLTPRDLARKWQENVHPTAFGYDEIGLLIYQHLQRILPQN
jgi:hypothetical protein